MSRMPRLFSPHIDNCRFGVLRGGGTLGLVVLVLMLVTEPLLPIVWDEGFTLFRFSRVRGWLAALRDPEAFAASWNSRDFGVEMDDHVRPPRAGEINSRSKLFSPRVVAWFWPFARDEPHGHPPFTRFWR